MILHEKGELVAMKNVRYALFLLAVVLILSGSGFAGLLHAQSPGMEAEAPSHPDVPAFLPPLGTYYYCFEFNSISIGTALITIHREGEHYKMVVSARTNDTVDRVYKIRYRGENLTEPDHLAPVETKIYQRVKSTLKEYVIRFLDDGVIATSEKKMKKGRVVNNNARQLHPERFTADPFSATYLARALEWREGLEQVFEIYTGKKRYELRLTCTGRSSVETLGEKRDSWVIVPRVNLLDTGEGSPDSGDTKADIKIYLSADESKDVLKIEARHTMGTFLVLLDRFEAAADVQETP